MKKPVYKKAAKITGCILGACLLALITWANWNETTFTEQHTAIANYKTYDISGIKDPQMYALLEKRMSQIHGVTACTINSTDKLAGIIFMPDTISNDEVKAYLSAIIGAVASEKSFEVQKSGCPVTGVKYFILHVKEIFRFRS